MSARYQHAINFGELIIDLFAGGGGKSVLVAAFMAKHYGGVTCHTLDRPLGTITTVDHHSLVTAFLVKYYGSNFAIPVDEPLRTITTVDRFALVKVAGIDYPIQDIGLRMLQPRELYTAQGFPSDYIIDVPINGKPMTKKAQVRMVGNSVSPQPAAALIAANYKHNAVVERGAA